MFIEVFKTSIANLLIDTFKRNRFKMIWTSRNMFRH